MTDTSTTSGEPAQRPTGTRVTSAQLVGRVAELRELRAALARTASGEPGLVLIGGDSGIGKTRLVSALQLTASETGARTIGGECFEVGEAELPYAPLVSALRPLAREAHPALAALNDGQRAQLASLLPGLSGSPAEAEEADETSQVRMFEALLALLDALGSSQPTLLVIEDLHWADHSTRAFIGFLARALTRERVLVCMTYRSDELHRRHPLRPLLAELDRQPRVRRLQLAPLAREEVAAALADILGHSPEPDLLERLYRRSEGNPLYVEELLAAGGNGHGPLPNSLREALMLRIERLDPQSQRPLRLLAVGQRLDHSLLSYGLKMDGGELLGALRELVAHHLVVVDGEGRYQFRHALLREVVSDDLLPGERAELHLALAQAMQAKADAGEGDAQLASGIAHHYHAAGKRREALASSVSAGVAAAAAHAHSEAAALFERALELWDQVADPEEAAGCDHLALLLRAAEAHASGGDRGRQEALVKAAWAEVDAVAEPRRAAYVLGRLARVQRGLNRTTAALETARRALALLADDPCPERASLLAFVGKTRVLQGAYRDAAEPAVRALEEARQVGDRASEAQALDVLALSKIVCGQVDEGRACAEAAIRLARRERRGDILGTVYLNLADALHLRGRSEEAHAVLETALGQPTAARTRNWLRTMVAELAIDTGRWDEVEQHLPVADVLMGNELLNVQLRRAELALGRGQNDAAREILCEIESAVAESGETQFVGVYAALRGELRRRSGRHERAAAWIADALDRIEHMAQDPMRLARVAATGVLIEADRAELARDLGDGEQAKAAVERASQLLARARAAADAGGPVEAAWHAAAEAHASRARAELDPERFAGAARAWDELGRPYSATCLRRYQAETELLAGRRSEAAATAAAALAQARALGAAGLVAELEALIARGRLRMPASPSPEPSETAEPKDPFGLTARERQVLALVARGATNREIGSELFMAEKTASVHVSRIMAKLDVRSRTEAAGVAYRVGLVSDNAAAPRSLAG